MNSSNKYDTVSSGIRFGTNLSLLGIVVVAFGIFSIYDAEYLIGALEIAFGVMVAFGDNGIQFNLSNQKYREYYGFIIIKLGLWKPVNKFDLVEIKRAKSKQTLFSRSGERTFRQNSYDVYLGSTQSKTELLVARFTKLKYAQEFMIEYGKKLNFNTIDRISKAREASLKKRAEGNKYYQKK